MRKSALVIIHLSYWLMYLFVFTILLGATNMNQPDANLTLFKVLSIALFTPLGFGAIIPALIGFYLFYAYFFDKYLKTKKIIQLLLAVIISTLLISAITQVFIYLVFSGTQMDINWCLNTCIFMGLFLSFISLVHGAIALVVKGFITWYEEIKITVDLNKKNYEMELALIRAQINPHFLFNTINNIDVLILKDPIKASEYLNKLSEMMRFMLYESKSEKIPLEKEISYMEKYVELQKIRTSNPNYIQFEITGDTKYIQIEPMLFIPFLENAFKHTENKKLDSAIRISIDIDKDQIHFVCENAFATNPQLKPDHGGLGNELIEKRLNLLYPRKHKLDITNSNGIYKVNLTITQ